MTLSHTHSIPFGFDWARFIEAGCFGMEERGA